MLGWHRSALPGIGTGTPCVWCSVSPSAPQRRTGNNDEKSRLFIEIQPRDSNVRRYVLVKWAIGSTCSVTEEKEEKSWKSFSNCTGDWRLRISKWFLSTDDHDDYNNTYEGSSISTRPDKGNTKVRKSIFICQHFFVARYAFPSDVQYPRYPVNSENRRVPQVAWTSLLQPNLFLFFRLRKRK